MGLGIKREDTVLVVQGKEKGKRGRVIAALPKKDTLLVEQVNVVKKHMKPNKQYQQGGIIEREAPLHRSKVMLVCPKCDQPTRVGNMVLEDGRKLRACKKCGEVIDK
jgi:large subunit ribosomal protein L24